MPIAAGEVGRVDEAARAELRGRDRRDVVVLVGRRVGRLGRAVAHDGGRFAAHLGRVAACLGRVGAHGFRRVGRGRACLALFVRRALCGAFSLCVFFDGHR